MLNVIERKSWRRRDVVGSRDMTFRQVRLNRIAEFFENGQFFYWNLSFYPEALIELKVQLHATAITITQLHKLVKSRER